ncbi:MAG: peptidylprolyl isomerase [archaeon]
MAEFYMVTYTGREKDTGAVFDTNDAEAAKREGILVRGREYKPALMITGDNQLIKGFEEALSGMKTGDKKIIEIPPAKAYGERKPELVKLVPIKPFADNNIVPSPGMALEVDGRPVRVQSVSGGRVRLDFNHELAGKTLIFEITVNEKIEKIEDAVQALFERFFPETKEKAIVKKIGQNLEITLPKCASDAKSFQTRKVLLMNEIKRYFKPENISVSEQQ